MRRGVSEAETCHINGWTTGTCLEGDGGSGPSVIRITAIGETVILARRILQNGEPVKDCENLWTLECREWVEVAHP